MPLISIIIPVYNAEVKIYETIKSIINQNFGDFELLLINDGSKDNSGSICKEFNKEDNRIRVFHQKNSGPSAARNKGIKEARGKFIAFVDADDTVETNWLKTMIVAQEKDNVDLVCTGYNKIVFKDNEVIRTLNLTPTQMKYKNSKEIKNNLESIVGNGFFNALWNKLYKAEIIRKNNITLDEDFSLGEDFLFNLDYVSECNSLVLIDVALYNYMVNSTGLTHKYIVDKFDLLDKINEKYRDFIYDNNMDLKVADFSTMKICYSCFMDLFHENNCMSFSEKQKYIRSILDKEKVENMIKRNKSRNIKDKTLLLILKSNSTYLIYVICWFLFIPKLQH